MIFVGMVRAKSEIIENIHRPISFSKAMVRALREGRKTQTRRLLVPQPIRGQIHAAPCRFGEPGDCLWVRERWAYRNQFSNPRARDGGPIVYAADLKSSRFKGRAWRQSMYMPRIASRLTLQITSTRIERLNQITSTDARAEGFDPQGNFADPIQWFAELWDSLNVDHKLMWRANPWVWVIGFKVLPRIQHGK
jgi:hypothetical protein